MEVEGEEVEYESDPEEAILTLSMRRREASDDEEGEGKEKERENPMASARSESDGESDGQGGAPAYEDEESEIEEEGEEDIEEEEEDNDGDDDDDDDDDEFEERGQDAGGVEEVLAQRVAEFGGAGNGNGNRLEGEVIEFHGKNQIGEEEKKENEPFAVPMAGAFYMHDDRFRDSGGGGGGSAGRHRRTPGGRKLWESKDERAWVHDRFEEMNLQDSRYDEERRTSKSRFRGQGRNRGMDHGYVRGNRSRAYDDRNNQNHTSKTVRGRGPRRYEPPPKNNGEIPANQKRQSGKSFDASTNIASGKVLAHTSNKQPNPTLPRKHVFASSLSSASPPFYPSGSSNQEISMTQKRDVQTGIICMNLQSPVVIEEKLSTSNSSALRRGKAIVDPIGQDKSYSENPIRPVGGKPLTSLQLQSSGSPSPVNPTQSLHSRVQVRGLTVTEELNYQPNSSLNQVNRVPTQKHLPTAQLRSVQNLVLPALRGSTQQLGPRPASGTQPSSPPQDPQTNSPDAVEIDSPPGSGKTKTALAGKGKTSIQGSGRASFLYNGAQVIGATRAMGVAYGDQSFPATPALLPVMQFGGQHRGGLGVSAVGMALPGYVSQPQLGFGNSDMTWVPVLAGAAGALGATYCSPYIAVDGGYYARPSGQTSSLGVSKETSTAKSSNILKPLQRSELVDDESGQRQNKPRRYSEMNFGQ